MYAWATASSASVVTPGAISFAASSIARAAIRPAIRIFSIVSAVCTSGPVYGVGAGLPTYSGRAMCAGTLRVGDWMPGTRAMAASLAAGSRRPRVVCGSALPGE
ncbi:hypothetical protein GCM10010502_08870 [Kitasatospora aureofaciens]|uniref:Uncharacterized protein n=1 Tax=Kitasatospora aureofaciens TaxID=1894 RepID=A0A8H9HEU8_KITAU|nr:hypothetical protein GCM10010502_08870 [Kitasatospora aureofaciens]